MSLVKQLTHMVGSHPNGTQQINVCRPYKACHWTLFAQEQIEVSISFVLAQFQRCTLSLWKLSLLLLKPLCKLIGCDRHTDSIASDIRAHSLLWYGYVLVNVQVWTRQAVIQISEVTMACLNHSWQYQSRCGSVIPSCIWGGAFKKRDRNTSANSHAFPAVL